MFRDKMSDAMKELVAIASKEIAAARELTLQELEAVYGSGVMSPFPRPDWP
jgi:hypothetical protein